MPVTIEMLREKLETLINTPYISDHTIPVYRGCIDGYNTFILDRLRTVIGSDDASFVLELERLLAENWARIQGTGLCYTAQPDSPITDLLCNVAAFVAQEKDVGIIDVLMPTVFTDSDVDPRNYPNLEPADVVATKAILKTHILGSEGLSLIPVRCINNYDESVGFRSIVNPYFNVFDHPPALAHLNEEEIHRLIEHSNLTREVYDAKKVFENYASNQESLLGQLRHLSSQLYYNSVNGVGTETIAGAGFSAAIVNFISYYDQLGPAELARVPEVVKSEIESIRRHASTFGQNTSISSCLAIRRSDLEASMRGHEVVLGGIGLSDQTRAPLIAEAKTQLATVRNDLLRNIDEANYRAGFDKLGIPLNLIRQFNPNIVFSTLRDLDLFKFLSPAEVEIFCSDGDYKESIVAAIDSLENLVVLSLGLSPDRLASLLRGLEPLLRDRFLKKGKNYASATVILDQERRDVYWQQYQSQLPSVKGSDDVSFIFSVLTEQQQSLFYEAMRPRWGEILTSIFDVVSVAKAFKAEWRLEVFRLFKNAQLAKASGADLLSREQLGCLYDRLEHRMESISGDATDINWRFYWAYGVEFAKIATLPGIKKYGFSPYESPSAFFTAISVTPVCGGLALAAAVGIIGMATYAIWRLVHADFILALGSTFLAALAMVAAVVLAAATVALAVLTIPAIVIRTTATAGVYLMGGAASGPEQDDVNSEVGALTPA